MSDGCDLMPDPNRQTVPMTDAELEAAQAECSAALANIGQEFLEGMGERVDPLDPIMQAAERLRRYIHAPSDVDPEKAFREVYGGGTADDAALARYQTDVADFLGAVLPKGKRPVAVTEGDGFAPYIDPMSCEVIDLARFTAGRLDVASKYHPDDWEPEDPRRVAAVASRREALVELQHQWLEILTNRIASLARDIDSEPAR